MNRRELHKHLQQEYSQSKKGFGTERGKIEPYKSTFFVIPPPPPSRPPDKLHVKSLSAAHRTMREIPLFSELSNLDQMVLGLLVRREALASSRMEGTWSTIDHVLTPGELINHKEKSPSASVRGYAEAMSKIFFGIEKGNIKTIDENIVRALHKSFMSKDPNFRGIAGKFRQEMTPPVHVVIGGFPRIEDSIYNPVPPEHLKKQMQLFFEWVSDDLIIEMGNAGQGLSLVLRMALGHIFFEAIHPFTDGNGRVGRMIMAVQMMLDGLSPLYLSGYIEMKKEDYNQTLAHAQKKLDYAPFVRFLSEAISGSWNESQHSKKVLLELPATWNERGNFRKNSAALKTLDVLLSHPILSATTLQQLLKISAPAAGNALRQLVEAKILFERTGFERNRVFAAEEVIAILARPLDEAPETARDQGLAMMKENF